MIPSMILRWWTFIPIFFFELLYHERVLGFVKYFVSTYLNNHVFCPLLISKYGIVHWFLDIKQCLPFWDNFPGYDV